MFASSREVNAAAWTRAAANGIVAVSVGLVIAGLAGYLIQPDRWLLAVDYQLYMDVTARWLAGGPYFEPHQLAGPYIVTPGDVLYPPYALPLFVVFTALPPLLWWVIPIGGTALLVLWHRPSAVAWVGIALCLLFPATSMKILTGNPVMWAVLAVAAGTRWHWPGVFALIKPSLFPFAMIDLRYRSWWIALAGYGLVAMAFAPLMLEWITAVSNSQNPGGLLYSLQEVPMMLIPVLAWRGSTRGR